MVNEMALGLGYGLKGTFIAMRGKAEEYIQDSAREVVQFHLGILWWGRHRTRVVRTPVRRRAKALSGAQRARLKIMLARKIFESKVRIKRSQGVAASGSAASPPAQVESKARPNGPVVASKIPKWRCACRFINFGFRKQCMVCPLPAPAETLLALRRQLDHVEAQEVKLQRMECERMASEEKAARALVLEVSLLIQEEKLQLMERERMAFEEKAVLALKLAKAKKDRQELEALNIQLASHLEEDTFLPPRKKNRWASSSA